VVPVPHYFDSLDSEDLVQTMPKCVSNDDKLRGSLTKSLLSATNTRSLGGRGSVIGGGGISRSFASRTQGGGPGAYSSQGSQGIMRGFANH